MPSATPAVSTATATVPAVPVAASWVASAPITAEAGRVSSQASAIRRATPHRTVAPRRPRLAPKIEPVATWVVDSGKPRWLEVRITAVVLDSATKPCGLWMSLIRRPRVRMIRHPPSAVPDAMATAQLAITHSGGSALAGSRPTVTSVRVITPMVFCASLVPCDSATIEADTTCVRRKNEVSVPCSTRRAIRYSTAVATSATTPATTGDSTRGSSTLLATLENWMASDPAYTQVAPISPPNSACEELDGRLSSQVSRFQTIAPSSPPKITTGVILASFTRPPEIVLATATERKAPTRFRAPASRTATLGRNAPVAIEVAIAFAVSWKPLVKSNTRAVMITATTRTDIPVLQTPPPGPTERSNGVTSGPATNTGL